MDMKASARSKRAQSQRGKSKFNTKHPHSQSHQHKKNEQSQQQQQAEKVEIREPPQTLPSNWDRYEELHSSGSEGEFNLASRKEEETVPVKSKGADYSYLLSQSHNETNFDAHLPEYAEGLGSMLYVRGHNLLSWGGEDNFIVNNDNTYSDYEASFLSLDLHGLASQLAQLDLSKRLFIEEDILPAELRSSNAQLKKHQLEGEQEQAHSNEDKLRVPKVKSERKPDLPPFPLAASPSFAAADRLNEKAYHKDDLGNLQALTSKSVSSKECLSETLGDGTILRDSGKEATLPLSASSNSQARVGAVPYKAAHVEKLQKNSLKNNEKLYNVPRHDPKEGTGRFEAASAEAELDALLDGLDELGKPSTSKMHETSSDPFLSQGSSYKGIQPYQEPLRGSSNLLSGNNSTADDLLGGTFNKGDQKGKEKITHGSETLARSILTVKSEVSTSKNAPQVLEDDFDAWLDTL